MKQFYKIVFFVGVLVLVFGFVLPFLFSLPSTEACIAGVCIIIFFLPLFFKFCFPFNLNSKE